jgi:hypothetical protein
MRFELSNHKIILMGLVLPPIRSQEHSRPFEMIHSLKIYFTAETQTYCFSFPINVTKGEKHFAFYNEDKESRTNLYFCIKCHREVQCDWPIFGINGRTVPRVNRPITARDRPLSDA